MSWDWYLARISVQQFYWNKQLKMIFCSAEQQHKKHWRQVSLEHLNLRLYLAVTVFCIRPFYFAGWGAVSTASSMSTKYFQRSYWFVYLTPTLYTMFGCLIFPYQQYILIYFNINSNFVLQLPCLHLIHKIISWLNYNEHTHYTL